MDTLLSVLLFLNVITPGGNYTRTQINDFATIYSAQINVIENNFGELISIVNEYDPEAYVILDNLGG